MATTRGALAGRALVPSTSKVTSRPCLAWARGSGRRAPAAAHRPLVVCAIAAPDAPAAKAEFTAWDTAVQRVAKRTDLKTIMILGAGPIVIGQVRQGRRGSGAARPRRPALGRAAGRRHPFLAPLAPCARRAAPIPDPCASSRPHAAPLPSSSQACEFDYSGTQACKALKCVPPPPAAAAAAPHCLF